MDNSVLQQKLEELFEELIFSNETIPIIVEGKNDEAALRKIGVMGIIIRLNIGQSILNFCEDIARSHDQVIILTDWDDKGKQLFTKLKDTFKHTNVKPIEKFWLGFKRYCSKEITEVEYLTKFMGEEDDRVINLIS